MVFVKPPSPPKHGIDCYVALLFDYLHPFIDCIFPNKDGIFQHDNLLLLSKFLRKILRSIFELIQAKFNGILRRDLFTYKILHQQLSFSCEQVLRSQAENLPKSLLTTYGIDAMLSSCISLGERGY